MEFYEKLNSEYKICFTLCVKMSKFNVKTQTESIETIYFPHHAIHLQNVSISCLQSFFTVKIEEFTNLSSGLTIKHIGYMDIHLCTYHSLPTHKGHGHFMLPTQLKNKKAVINIQNSDNKCFLWAVLSILHYDDVKDHRYRVCHYEKWVKDINVDKLEFPFKVNIKYI